MENSISLADPVTSWPQGRIEPDCFVTVSMDLTAPFLSDMGLDIDGLEPLRRLFRDWLNRERGIVVEGQLPRVDRADWVTRLSADMRDALPFSTGSQFWTWIRDTYILAPADRPNWSRYEMFFFQWPVGMRDEEDRARCFRDARAISEAYCAFVRRPNLEERIRERGRSKLSTWDQEMFGIRRYSLNEDDGLQDFVYPFAIVEATAELNYFRRFWEHIRPQLSNDELRALYGAISEYYQKMASVTELVRPENLDRRVR
jgi:hypothetical protein